jgi:hypothetical protein
VWRASEIILASRTLTRRVCCAACTCSTFDRRCSRCDRVPPSRSDRVPPSRSVSWRPVGCAADEAQCRLPSPHHAGTSTSSTAHAAGRDRYALFYQPTDLARILGSRQRLVFRYVHQSTSGGSGIDLRHTTLLCAASAFHPTCVLLRLLPN